MDVSKDRRSIGRARSIGQEPAVRAGRGMRSGMLLAATFALAGTALVFALTSTSATGFSLPSYVSATPKATAPATASTTTTLPVIRRAVIRGTTTYITPLPRVGVEDDRGRALEVEGLESGDDPPGPPPKGDS